MGALNPSLPWILNRRMALTDLLSLSVLLSDLLLVNINISVLHHLSNSPLLDHVITELSVSDDLTEISSPLTILPKGIVVQYLRDQY